MKFKIEFIKKRKSTECELSLIEEGDEYEILYDKGFGIADICSFALRVAYVMIDDVDKVIILDEPFRNLDKERTQYASRMVSELSHKLGIQFIICTHIDDLSDAADRIVKVKLVKKDTSEVSYVR